MDSEIENKVEKTQDVQNHQLQTIGIEEITDNSEKPIIDCEKTEILENAEIAKTQDVQKNQPTTMGIEEKPVIGCEKTEILENTDQPQDANILQHAQVPCESIEAIEEKNTAIIDCKQTPIQKTSNQIVEESDSLQEQQILPSNNELIELKDEKPQESAEFAANNSELMHCDDEEQSTQSKISCTIDKTAEQSEKTGKASNIEIVSDLILTNAAPLNASENNKNEQQQNSGALGLLTQYDSDISDSETEIQSQKHLDSNMESVQAATTNAYRAKIHTDSSDTDDSSDSSTSDTSDDQAEGNRTLHRLRKKIDKCIGDGSDEDDDDDDDDDADGQTKRKQQRQPLKVKGELLLIDLPPIEDLHITVPEEECIEFGKVHSIVDQLLLVSVLPNSLLLDLETVLFLDKGKRVLGEVFDVLGQVSDPLYCVRFNSNVHIQEKHINIGDKVYVAPKTEYTQYIILSNLMKMRGSDASWENDIEPPPRFLDYSDDEQERLARTRIRNKDRQEPAEHGLAQKRTYAATSAADEINEDNDDNMSVISCSTMNSDTSSRAQWRGGRGRGQARGRGRGRGQEYAQNTYQYPPPPINAGSWHSHYYGMQPYHNAPAPYYNFAPNFPPMHSPFMPPYGPPPQPHPSYWTSQPPPQPPPTQPPNQ